MNGPPLHDLDAERVVIGAMLLDADTIGEVAGVIDAAAFWPAHAALYQTLIGLHAAGEPTDPVAVIHHLASNGGMPPGIDAAYLHTLIAAVPTTANAGFYARIVAEKAARRRGWEIASRAAQIATQSSADGLAEDYAQAGVELVALADGTTAAQPNPLAGRLLDRAALANLPCPEPLITGTLDLRTLVLIAGPWSTGKTLCALGWGCCVATGQPWQGRDVTAPGRVLVVVGEGAYGLDQRIAAWESHQGQHVDPATFDVLPDPVQFTDKAAVDQLVALVAARGYRLVIVDTVSRCLTGENENTAEVMSLVVDGADRMRKATTDTTVLLVHHTGKDGVTVRGSYSLEAGVDTIYQTAGDGHLVRLDRTKRKDGPRDDTVMLRLVEVADSVVLAAAETQSADATAAIEASRAAAAAAKSRTEDAVLDALKTTFAGKPIGPTDLATAVGISRSSVYLVLRVLIDRGVARSVGTKGRALYQSVPFPNDLYGPDQP